MLHWSNGTATTASRFRAGGRVIEPAAAFGWYKRTLLLPTGARDHGSTESLFHTLQQVLSPCRLAPELTSILSAWALTSWFSDSLALSPLVLITGTPSTADRLLRGLHSLCRTPLLLAGASLEQLSALPIASLQPTLLIAQPRHPATMLPLLAASCRRGYLVSGRPPRGSPVSFPVLQSLSCAAAVYLGEEPSPLRLPNSLSLHLAASLDNDGASDTALSEAVEIQNRLLHYRLVHRPRLAQPGRALPSGAGELDEIAALFRAVLFDAPELQAKLTEQLDTLSDCARDERAGSDEARVLEAILRRLHAEKRDRIFLAEIVDALSPSGAPPSLSAEKVGHIMKRLGLPSRRLSAAGRGLLLPPNTVEVLHRLARHYQVLEPPGEQCDACRALSASASGVENVGCVGCAGFDGESATAAPTE